MEKMFELGHIIRMLAEHMDSDAMFVITRKDVQGLENEVKECMEWMGEYSTHPDIFFKFENYPVLINMRNIDKMRHVIETAGRYYSAHPDGRCWIEVKSVKS